MDNSFFQSLSGHKAKTPYCSAVVLAAGSSVRMGGADKIFAELAGRPAVAWTLRALEDTEPVSEIIVVTHEEKLEAMSALCKEYGISKTAKVVAGGDSRMRSAWIGINEVSKKAKYIATHDGARPLATPELISGVIRLGFDTGAAAAAVKMRDTIARAKEDVLCGHLNREEFVRIQTPQVFEAELLKAAIFKAIEQGDEVSDDSTAVQLLGMTVHIAPGSEENFKLTTASDLLLAGLVLEERRR